MGAEIDVVGEDRGVTPTTPLLSAIVNYSEMMYQEEEEEDEEEEEEEEEIQIQQQQQHQQEDTKSKGLEGKDLYKDQRKLKRQKAREEKQKRYRKIIDLFLEKGCDLNLHGEDDPSPLGACCTRKELYGVLKLLLDHGADINCPDPDSGETPIYSAVNSDDVQGLLIFIENGADIFVSVTNHWWQEKSKTLLEHSAEYGNFRCAQVLIEAGCSVTRNVKNALVNACERYIRKKEGTPLLFSADWVARLKIEDEEIKEKARQERLAAKLAKEDKRKGDRDDSEESEQEEDDTDDEEPQSGEDDIVNSSDGEEGDGNDFYKTHKSYEGIRTAIKELIADLDKFRPLKWQCGTFLRNDCRMFKPKDVVQLPLPPAMQKYLLCQN